MSQTRRKHDAPHPHLNDRTLQQCVRDRIPQSATRVQNGITVYVPGIHVDVAAVEQVSHRLDESHAHGLVKHRAKLCVARLDVKSAVPRHELQDVHVSTGIQPTVDGSVEFSAPIFLNDQSRIAEEEGDDIDMAVSRCNDERGCAAIGDIDVEVASAPQEERDNFSVAASRSEEESLVD